MDRRKFLLSGVAAGGAALAPAAFAAASLEGAVTRVSGQAVRLDWNAKTKPTSVYVGSNPAATTRGLRAVKTNVVGGVVELPAAVTPRPYFLLAEKGGRQTRVAERLLPLEGGRNFRDLGGYRGAGGRQVAWGKIYRSGVMSGLTPADFDYLSALGIKVICDLRSPQERAGEPSPFLANGKAKVVSFDYDMNSSMAKLATATTRAQAIDVFASAYVDFLEMLAPHYTDLFAHLVANEGPLTLNCSAGKDRTGVGSALILSVLGVPRETIVADYALTQVYTPPSFYKKQMAGGANTSGINAQQAQAMARLPPEVLDVILGSDPAVMRQALAAIDAKHGGPVALAKSRFGLTDGKIARLRSLYLV
ncbi:tyrosine-protein phosphatase [soil metagenome]